MSPINETTFKSQTFKLQVDSGENKPVTNNRDMLHASREIAFYKIDGIRDRIVCTSKVVFHLIYDNGLVLPVIIFYSEQVTEMVILPKYIIFPNMDACDSWWQVDNCSLKVGELRF